MEKYKTFKGIVDVLDEIIEFCFLSFEILSGIKKIDYAIQLISLLSRST